MDKLILHHYAGSPFSEKVRLMLGFKGLEWASVTVPVIMPKPDLVALTGGYRKTPILQVGADIYCDTALIARKLQAWQPRPSLFPPSAPLSPLLAQWADSTLFWTVIPYTMQPLGLASIFSGVPPEVVKAFAADRAPFTAGLRRPSAADAAAQLRASLAALEGQLADGRHWLFGDDASVADFSVAHCLWYVRRAPPLANILDPFGRLSAWLDRVLALGHGRSVRLGSDEALAIAAGASSHVQTSVDPAHGWAEGQPAVVAAIDYGTDPVAGLLVGLDDHEVVLERHDERAGAVHVHFPRFGFQIKQEQA